MKRLDRIAINILTPLNMASREYGDDFVELITSEFPFLSPDKYGNLEPLRNTYVEGQKDRMLDCWGNTFIWSRSRPFVEGDVHFRRGPRPTHSWIVIRLDKKVNIIDVVRFLQKIAVRFGADFASVHYMAQEEVAEILGDLANGVSNPRLLFDNPRNGLHRNIVTSHHLQRFLPNLYWATIFGPPYVDLFGKELLLTAPAFQVTELAEKCVYMQLSPNPLDFASDYASQNRSRQHIKDYLDHDAFLDYSYPLDHRYSVPTFRI